MAPMTLDELTEAIDTYKLPELRDRFAIAALTGLLSSRAYTDPNALAAEAYEIADAMIAEMGDGAAEAAERPDPSDQGPVTP
jgi:hypothetical protein